MFDVLGPLSVERYPDADDEVDVDVVDCSDSETASAIRHLHHRHHGAGRGHHHHHKSTRHHAGDCELVISGGNNPPNSSSKTNRGQASPSSPGNVDEERLSPEPAKVKSNIIIKYNISFISFFSSVSSHHKTNKFRM